jgi:hypothetical protein
VSAPPTAPPRVLVRSGVGPGQPFTAKCGEKSSHLSTDVNETTVALLKSGLNERVSSCAANNINRLRAVRGGHRHHGCTGYEHTMTMRCGASRSGDVLVVPARKLGGTKIQAGRRSNEPDLLLVDSTHLPWIMQLEGPPQAGCSSATVPTKLAAWSGTKHR